MKRIIMVGLLTMLIVATAVTFAQPIANTISWWTVDGGGGSSSGGQYALGGTAGQFDAHIASTGGNYAVSGGYWQPGAIGREYELFLPMIQN